MVSSFKLILGTFEKLGIRLGVREQFVIGLEDVMKTEDGMIMHNR